ncbi:ATP-binding cassette domain-containing protein [Actinoplanes sp. NBRC 103695]|uniref:ATP-binding cassette domain-containing protein n=1 Tax=Actinoplanes sp. NBRC 103695 TaxID=3032202 RepID=UPI0024A4DDA0|nr:ATP-binding cassette domain-containing protein [Actinoplanes sp. NBRC 103695]GLY96282.1 ABC transporter ATP-binding protein [Actinoplanes sp. NBRC 103695]
MRFEDVWFRYARRADWTLSAVDVAIRPGETVVVLGRNGAGKSTLLQLAAGVLSSVRGRVTDRPDVVGWVPERFPADQPFTAEQYLRRMADIRGGSGVDEWFERLKFAEHRHTRLADLSKGTAQKVGVVQALLLRPGLLVLDEPWEGLDAVARELIPDIVAEVTAAGGAVLVSDHRGEIARLPEAIRWTVADNTVRPGDPEPDDGATDGATGGGSGGGSGGGEVIIEIAARRSDADRTMAELRDSGHRVLGVRTEHQR